MIYIMLRKLCFTLLCTNTQNNNFKDSIQRNRSAKFPKLTKDKMLDILKGKTEAHPFYHDASNLMRFL